MGALLKAVLVAVFGMALQGFIRHKNLLPHLEQHRVAEWFGLSSLFCLLVGS